MSAVFCRRPVYSALSFKITSPGDVPNVTYRHVYYYISMDKGRGRVGGVEKSVDDFSVRFPLRRVMAFGKVRSVRKTRKANICEFGRIVSRPIGSGLQRSVNVKRRRNLSVYE